jgi:hypothetical protein
MLVGRPYVAFVRDDKSWPPDGRTIYAPNKKAAHEAAQVAAPGAVVEVYAPDELALGRRVDETARIVGSLMVLARLAVDEVTDWAALHRRLLMARDSIGTLYDYSVAMNTLERFR